MKSLLAIGIAGLIAVLVMAGTANAAPKSPHGPWVRVCVRVLYRALPGSSHPPYLCRMVKIKKYHRA